MARKLRVATDADQPTKVQTLAEAIESGSYVDILRAQRRQMVKDVANMSGPALAALHRQIALHSKEIAAIEDAERDDAASTESTVVDDGDFDASAV